LGWDGDESYKILKGIYDIVIGCPVSCLEYELGAGGMGMGLRRSQNYKPQLIDTNDKVYEENM
jgi:hypothetical protein